MQASHGLWLPTFTDTLKYIHVQCIIQEILYVGGWVVAERREREKLGTAFGTTNSHVTSGNQFDDHSVMVVTSQLVQ